jgi:hypothetical protein
MRASPDSEDHTLYKAVTTRARRRRIVHRMKTHFGLVVLLAAFFLTGCATSSPRSTTYEYKILNGKVFGPEQRLDDALNLHIADGWKVVSPVHFGANDLGYAVLKRPEK